MMGELVLVKEVRVGEVRLLGPLTVDHAIELAHRVEDKIRFGKGKG